MKAKRSTPAAGPLVTFALMIASIAAVAAVARYLESRESTTSAPTVVSSSGEHAQTSGQH